MSEESRIHRVPGVLPVTIQPKRPGPMAHTPLIPGQMEPRAFVCYMCRERVVEESHGKGFPRCGAIQAEKERMLCSSCLSKVMEFVEENRRGGK